MNKSRSGFTIVELLIVIVVIGILAAITIVAYNGIQNKANDSAVKSDLASIGKKFEIYKVENGVYPRGSGPELYTLDLRVSRSSYGSHYDNGSGTFNFLSCWARADTPDKIALIASSKSGNIFMYQNGTVSSFTGRWTGSPNSCADAGVAIDGTSGRDFFFSTGVWLPYVKS